MTVPARTCANCGADVGALAERCLSCGADPDLYVVDLGGLAPLRRRQPDQRGRPGRTPWWLPLAVVVAAAAGLALATGSSDGDGQAAPSTTPTTRPTTTTTRPAPVTTTTSTLPPGPLLGEPSSMMLAFLGPWSSQVIDLDTGVQWRVTGTVLGAHAGRVLVDDDGPAWWPPPYDGTGAQTYAVDLDLPGPSGPQGPPSAYIDQETGVAWLINWNDPLRVVRLGPSGSVHEISLGTSRAWPVGVLSAGLVVSAPGGTYLLDADDGAIRRVVGASALLARGEHIVIEACDEHLRCRFEVIDSEGDVVEVLATDPRDQFTGLAALAPDGRIATANPAQGVLAGANRITIDGEVVLEADTAGIQTLEWSPDGRWLLAPTFASVIAIDTTTRASVDIPIRPLGAPPGLVAFRSA